MKRGLSFSLTYEEIAAAVGARPEDVHLSWPAVERALAERGLTDGATKIAAIATIVTEVGHGFRPIDEVGGQSYFTEMYEGRRDLGNVRKGDGAKYHGRGFIQLTGRANYRRYGRQLGAPLERRPELALAPEVAAEVLADYFKTRRIDASAAAGDWEAVRRKVNGGLNGWYVFSQAVRALERANEEKASRAPSVRGRALIAHRVGHVSAGIRVSGICELALETLDLAASERFYAEVLGWPVVERWSTAGGEAVWVMAGDRTRIGLWKPQIGLGGGRGGVHVHYAVHVDPGEYERAVAQLRGHGLDVYDHDHSDYGRGRGRAAYVTDPAGHVVELWTWDVATHLEELPDTPGSH